MKSILLLFIIINLNAFSQEAITEKGSKYFIEIMNNEVKDDYVQIFVLSDEGNIVKVLRTQFIDGLSSFELDIIRGLYTIKYFYDKKEEHIYFNNHYVKEETKTHVFELNLQKNYHEFITSD